MRLSVLDSGHRLRARLFLTMTSATSRDDSADIVRMLLYRPDFLTRPLLELTAVAMRGPSYWTAAEREYFGMCTAQLHKCPFCADTHAEMIRIAAHGEISPDDPAGGRPEVHRAREFLDAVSGNQAPPAPDLPPNAVLEALRVNVVWNIVNRLANAFDFELRGNQLHTGTKALHRFGYRFPAFLLAGGDPADQGDPVENIRHSVLAAPAVTPPELRVAAATGDGLADPWRSYAQTVRDASYRVTDADVAALKANGHTEDEIFEVTVAVAVGAASHSYQLGRVAV
jgi:alkylhydroperoxidase family enzyme